MLTPQQLPFLLLPKTSSSSHSPVHLSPASSPIFFTNKPQKGVVRAAIALDKLLSSLSQHRHQMLSPDVFEMLIANEESIEGKFLSQIFCKLLFFCRLG